MYLLVIVPFNGGGVLPPFLGPKPGDPAAQSPYQATMLEVVERFGYTAPRCEILDGLLRFRAHLRGLDIREGFQWIDGSFVEDAEKTKGRPPGDVDVVTVARRPAHAADDVSWDAFVDDHLSDIFDPDWTKGSFKCDAYPIDLDGDAEAVAEQSAYWFGLFSHQRVTLQWKGIVTVRLEDDDRQAAAELALRAAICP